MPKNHEFKDQPYNIPKSLSQKFIQKEFDKIIIDLESKNNTSIEDKVSLLSEKINQLRLSPKSSSQKLATLIQLEIDNLVSKFTIEEDDIGEGSKVSLVNFYTLDDKKPAMKVNYFDLNIIVSSIKVINLYFQAFKTTIPDTFTSDSLTIFNPTKEITSWPVLNHPLEFNNNIYEEYSYKKSFKKTFINKNIAFLTNLYSKLNTRFNLNKYTLNIRSNYK